MAKSGAAEQHLLPRSTGNLGGARAWRLVLVQGSAPRPDLRDGTTVYIGVKPDGSLDMPNPSPLVQAGLRTAKQRKAWIVGLLEMRAALGSLQAADMWLRMYRWEAEMKQGRAPQRHEHKVEGNVRVIDDLGHGAGRKAVVDITPSSRPLPLPKGESRGGRSKVEGGKERDSGDPWVPSTS